MRKISLVFWGMRKQDYLLSRFTNLHSCLLLKSGLLFRKYGKDLLKKIEPNSLDFLRISLYINILLIFSPMSDMSDMSAFNVQPVTPISNRPYYGR